MIKMSGLMRVEDGNISRIILISSNIRNNIKYELWKEAEETYSCGIS